MSRQLRHRRTNPATLFHGALCVLAANYLVELVAEPDLLQLEWWIAKAMVITVAVTLWAISDWLIARRQKRISPPASSTGI